MRTYSNSTPVQRTFTLAIPFAVAAWLVTVPGGFTISGFLSVVALLIGLFWVATVTYSNGQPTPSLAQPIHDVEPPAAVEPRRDRR